MANVNPKDAQLVNEHLVQCLRDSVMVQNQTQVVHWGLLGSKFYQIHLLTGDIQTEMVEGIDNIAEHIRSINVMTPVSVVDLLSSRIKDIDITDPFDQDKIILDLSTAHDMLAGCFEELAMHVGIQISGFASQTRGPGLPRPGEPPAGRWGSPQCRTYSLFPL